MLINQPIHPVANALDRRWISDEYFDLIVWYQPEGAIHGFQLCYDKPGRERALTWTGERGFEHAAIDSGESKPTANRSPILSADGGVFPHEQVREEFIARSSSLPADIRDLVLTKIKAYEAQRRD